MSLQVGGVEEYAICDAIKSGRLFKPIVAWCIGTCAKMFTSEVQFGHAGASANSALETADAKNKVCACGHRGRWHQLELETWLEIMLEIMHTH